VPSLAQGYLFPIARYFEAELCHSNNGFTFRYWKNYHAEFAMDNAKKFRDYAAECRGLAQRASGNDRKVLMDIAEAWIACAEDAERKDKTNNKKE
jgi:hypothetical protein